jgi:hypothetical protein
MKTLFCRLLPLFLACAATVSPVLSQDTATTGTSETGAADASAAGDAPVAPDTTNAPAAESPEKTISNRASELVETTQVKVEELAEKVDQNVTAKEAAEGLLGKIYLLAEKLSFPAFHWVAFALMSAGTVSFLLQLVLGKLMVLFRGSINLKEILSDAFGLIISVVGLVLTTQAAAENSTFTHSPASVLSSAAAGVVLGFMLYRWGQSIEVNAVAGQRAQAGKVSPKS